MTIRHVGKEGTDEEGCTDAGSNTLCRNDSSEMAGSGGGDSNSGGTPSVKGGGGKCQGEDHGDDA